MEHNPYFFPQYRCMNKFGCISCIFFNIKSPLHFYF